MSNTISEKKSLGELYKSKVGLMYQPVFENKKKVDVKKCNELVIAKDKVSLWVRSFENGQRGDVLNEIGVMYWNKKNYGRAFNMFLKASKLKSGDAYFNLARCYESGKGVNKNLEYASILFETAGRFGRADGYVCAGRFYEVSWEKEDMRSNIIESGNLKKATELYAKAVKRGSITGYKKLAFLYLELMAKDEKKFAIKVFEAFQKAASLGCPDSCYKLALCHQYGIGTDIDLVKAFQWYLKSASLDDCPLEVYSVLSKFYEEGKGVEPNPVMAGVFFRIAKSLNN